MTSAAHKAVDQGTLDRALPMRRLTDGDLARRSIALILILLYSPLFVLVGVLVLMAVGRPVIYKGVRLGRHKRRFIMYKFRTMGQGADRLVGSDVVSETFLQARGLVGRFGKLLRDSRLDELPQLFNILRGDMAFIGPRPERPHVYERWCRTIPDYDKRFRVRPGLVGFSQIITPHSTPKRIRCLIDNRCATGHLGIRKYLTLFALLASGVTYHMSRDIYVTLRNFIRTNPLFGGHRENRRYDREPVSNIRVELERDPTDAPVGTDNVRLKEISEEAVVVLSAQPLPDDAIRFRMLREHCAYRHGRWTTKSARCLGHVERRWPSEDESLPYGHAVLYAPVSPLNRYKIDKYFLREGIA